MTYWQENKYTIIQMIGNDNCDPVTNELSTVYLEKILAGNKYYKVDRGYIL